MNAGIVFASRVNPDGSLQLFTKARTDAAVRAYNSSIFDYVIVSGRVEAN
jgi:vancomycin permeability regulator SanA